MAYQAPFQQSPPRYQPYPPPGPQYGQPYQPYQPYGYQYPPNGPYGPFQPYPQRPPNQSPYMTQPQGPYQPQPSPAEMRKLKRQHDLRAGFTLANLLTVTVIFRLIYAVAALGGLLSALAAQSGNDQIGFYQYSSLRSAYIAFSVIALIFSAIIFVLDWGNLFNRGFLVKIPINFIIFFMDVFIFITLGVTSIICIVRARFIPFTLIGIFRAIDFYRVPAFYAAAVFGFAVCALCIIEIIFLLIEFILKKANITIFDKKHSSLIV